MPQPNFVPVIPSTSRNTQSKGMSSGDLLGLSVDEQDDHGYPL
jgi:hypothetical protein